jgi:hypothetical protein
MAQQELRLSISEDLLNQAQIIADSGNQTLSEFVTQLLREKIAQAERYDEARKRQLALLEKGLSLNTFGEATWTREELHER